MGRDPERRSVSSVEPLAGQREIGAGLARHAREEPGRAHVREEANPGLRHGEAETIAGDTMRAVNRDADAAAHHHPVDDRDDWLAIALDRGHEAVFVAPERQRLVEAPGAAKIIQRTQIAAGTKSAVAGSGHDHAALPLDRLPMPPVDPSTHAPCYA